MSNNRRINKTLPKITETETEIRERLKSEPQVKRQNRLQALYLIVTKQAESRTTVAKMLGFNRNTISEWFGLYEAGGLEKLLDIYKPSGAQPKMTRAAAAEIEEILQSEKGFRTCKEIHRLAVKKHRLAVSYRAVPDLARYTIAAKLKSPRPSNPKKTKPKSKNSRIQLQRSLEKSLSAKRSKATG